MRCLKRCVVLRDECVVLRDECVVLRDECVVLPRRRIHYHTGRFEPLRKHGGRSSFDEWCPYDCLVPSLSWQMLRL
jgi:hypothetical protein